MGHPSVASTSLKTTLNDRTTDRTSNSCHDQEQCSCCGIDNGRAEGVGFEPTVSCPTHAFQACRFGRSRTPPGRRRWYRRHERALPCARAGPLVDRLRVVGTLAPRTVLGRELVVPCTPNH